MEIVRYLKSFNESKVNQDVIDDCKEILVDISDKENVEVFKCLHDGERPELFVVIGPKIYLNREYTPTYSNIHKPYYFGPNNEDFNAFLSNSTNFEYDIVKRPLLHLIRYLMDNKFKNVKYRIGCGVIAEWDLKFFYKKMEERNGSTQISFEFSFS